MTTKAPVPGAAVAPKSHPASGPDWPAVVAIALTAYLAGTIAHEVCGHGLAALAVGLHPTRVSTVDLEVSFAGAAAWKVRVVAAAGCAGNLVLAAIAMAALAWARRARTSVRYFLWLLATINILSPGGYLMVLALPGVGDWGDFVRGFTHPLVWKLGLTALGVLISLAGVRWGADHLREFGGEEAGRPRRLFRLALVPYLAGGIVETLAGALNPTSPMLILISAAAASFGGTCWLLWAGSRAAGAARAEAAAATARKEARPWSRPDWTWRAIGLAALVVYFAVLGPGLPR